MASVHTQSARYLARQILTHWDRHKKYASRLIDEKIHQTDRPGLLTDLVYGVIRNHSLLDTVLSNIAKIKIKHTENDLLNLLRIAVYEFIFCPETAEYAIVNEATDLAGKNQKRRGFVNAVLRSVQRAIEVRNSDLSTIDFERFIPTNPETGCLFKELPLAEISKDSVEYFSAVFSLPQWMIRIWLDTYGLEETRQICLGSNRTPGVIVQPNTLKTNAERLASELKSEAVEVEIFENLQMLKIKSHRSLTDLWTYQNGHFYIQDPSAAKVAKLIAPQPGTTVLDYCAAPGGKTVGIAMQMKNQGKIIATDIDIDRLKMVDENCDRLGITCVDCVPLKGIKDALGSKNKVPVILLDVPCSNTGVMARRVEVRSRLKPESLNKIIQTQKDLLESASKRVRKHGILAYSTCSVLPEENENLIHDFIGAHPEFKIEKEEITFPKYQNGNSIDHDGGYAVIMRKS